ncbi:hypothetical protein P43SY_006716 [Pythium insidiosum]|uniref:Uncharacterized protein n=1 Tax=Pythium insidiosum TaxID=114742 RepID=A0AAD5LQ15_PYTIN|nr:hypothetical protein P43SY_006716 [Pythium insidiosum]
MDHEHERLVAAVRQGDCLFVGEELRRQPALRHAADDARRSLVHHAVDARQLQVLSLLLEAAAPMEDEDDAGRTPLGLAVELGLAEFVRLLVVHGCDVHALDGDQQTPLHVAAIYDVVASGTLRCLLKHCTDLETRDLCANTPLHLAAAYGSIDTAKDLLQHGADVNALNASSSTPLHLAAPNGYEAIVRLLIAHGADVNARDACGNTPLLDAAFINQEASGHFACGDSSTQAQVIAVLLDSGADVRAANSDGDTALFGAVRHGNELAVASLLAGGASVTRRNRRRETVLHVAARAGIDSAALWKRLLDAGADVEAKDRFDRTCLSLWVSRPKLEREMETLDGDDGDASGTGDDVARLLQRAWVLS